MIGCRPLTDLELVQLLKPGRLPPRERALLILGYTTGFRISELLSLRVQDLLNTERIYLARRNTKGKVRGRTALLHPDAAEAVSHLIQAHRLQDTDYLFKGRSGPLSACQAWRLLTRAFKDLHMGGKVATHSLRKYFAQKVYEATQKDIRATQAALGHRSIESTAHYLSIDLDAIDKAVRSIGPTLDK